MAVNVAKLSQYTIVRAPLEVSKLSALVPMVTPLYVGKASLYAIIGAVNTQINRPFDFDFKVKVSSDFEIDWRVNAKISKIFSFNWKLNSSYFNKDFTFDWKKKLLHNFDFSYTIQDQPPLSNDIGARAYWRIRYRFADTDNTQYAELLFKDTPGGTDLCTGGTVIYSSQYNSGTPYFGAANAFDRNNSTGYAAAGNAGQWLGYHFASPVSVGAIDVVGSGSFPTLNAKGLLFEYSDDGSIWGLAQDYIDALGNLTAGGAREYTITPKEYNSGNTAAHRYWRWRVLVACPNDPYNYIGAIDFLDISNASLTAAHGGVATDSAHYSGFTAASGFAGTTFISNGSPTEFWLKWDFGSGNAQAVEQVKLAAVSGGNSIKMPVMFLVEYSDDDTNWVTRYVGEKYSWSSSESVNFPFLTPTPPAGVYRDFTFNYKKRMTVTKSFDYKVIRVVYREFSFDFGVEGFNASFIFNYRINLRANFSMDWGIKLFANKYFNWFVDGEFRTVNVFDWRIALGKDFSYNWRIKLARNLNLDWRIGEGGSANVNYIERFPESPITETWRYFTKINASENNSERRACLRQFPRIELSHQYIIENSTDYRLFRGYLFAQRNSNFYVAQHAQAVFLTAVSGYASTVLTMTKGNSDIRPDDFIALFNIGTEASFVVQAASVATDSITLVDGLPAEVGPGFVAIPLRLMQIGDSASLSMDPVTGSIGLAFTDMTDSREIMRPGVAAGLLDEHDGRVILTGRPQLTDGARDNAFMTGRQIIDYSPNLAPLTVNYWQVPEESFSYVTQFARGVSLDYWREFASTIRGSWKGFYLPTFRPDLVAASFAGSTLVIVGNKLDDILVLGGYKNLMITTDVGVQYVKITGSIVSGENTQLVIDNPISGAVIKEISFINLVRIVDDAITLTHNETVTRLVLNLKVIRQ